MSLSELFRFLKADYLRYIQHLGVNGKVNKYKVLISTLFGIGPFQAVIIYRISRWLYLNRVPFLHSILTKINMILNGIEIVAQADIGKGLMIAHTQGIVVGRNVVCGENLTLFHNVTLGAKTPFDGKEEMPTLGNNITIYAGAKVLGPITIGDNCKIGANTIVTTSIAENSTVVLDRNCILTLKK
ncbi:Serine acetyltransferase [Geobacillus thermodenitrificans]|uniref:serine O-acetyltransferase n=1 Tax=Geobacillus thermodenitrificans TaxID=33940 RepID=UPI000A293B39|nr:serine O-acetyltransferase [Geobacillus thermodenitrificans]ARP44332.1 Serine acetyltransferase [Geobacillus thermodenitrificans]